jgi:hypothetical protein
VLADAIRDAGIRDVADASIYAPNTYFSDFTARKLSNPRFRGIGTSPANPGITTYIDGVPQLNTNSSSVEFHRREPGRVRPRPAERAVRPERAGRRDQRDDARPSLGAWTGGVTAPLASYGAREVRARRVGPAGRPAGDRSVDGARRARRLHDQPDDRPRRRLSAGDLRQGAGDVDTHRRLGGAPHRLG